MVSNLLRRLQPLATIARPLKHREVAPTDIGSQFQLVISRSSRETWTTKISTRPLLTTPGVAPPISSRRVRPRPRGLLGASQQPCKAGKGKRLTSPASRVQRALSQSANHAGRHIHEVAALPMAPSPCRSGTRPFLLVEGANLNRPSTFQQRQPWQLPSTRLNHEGTRLNMKAGLASDHDSKNLTERAGERGDIPSPGQSGVYPYSCPPKGDLEGLPTNKSMSMGSIYSYSRPPKGNLGGPFLPTSIHDNSTCTDNTSMLSDLHQLGCLELHRPGRQAAELTVHSDAKKIAEAMEKDEVRKIAEAREINETSEVKKMLSDLHQLGCSELHRPGRQAAEPKVHSSAMRNGLTERYRLMAFRQLLTTSVALPLPPYKEPYVSTNGQSCP